MFGGYAFGEPYWGQAPVLVIVAIPPNVIEGFGSYAAQVDAMGADAAQVDAMGVHAAQVDGFGSLGEV